MPVLAQSAEPSGCDQVLPNGKTVGDVVQAQRSVLFYALDNATQAGYEINSLAVTTEVFMAIAQNNGPIDFKNAFPGNPSRGAVLGSAGNFAYYAIGSGYLPDFELDFGAGLYAVGSAILGRKPWSNLTGRMFSDASAKAVRMSALAAGGCL